MGVRQELADIKTLVIHCAATPNGRPFTADDIDQWHAERAFHRNMDIAPHHAPERTHIGYHFVIQTNGIPELGRPVYETGAHAAGHNTGSIAICMIGTDKFSGHQWETLRELVQDLTESEMPIEDILGHRDLPDVHKTCPGFSVAEWLQNDMRPLQGHVL